jgi:FKBP-type peptidyl-prolyl cis-trans isomerase
VSEKILLPALVLALAACGGDEPEETELQEIETVEFASSLGIDLAEFTELPSGVYVRDDVVGTGFIVEPGNEVTMTTTGWLADGTEFQPELQFTSLTNGLILGYEIGILDMRVGGERRMLIPPLLGYGRQGTTGIPGGSVLVFDVRIDGITE